MPSIKLPPDLAVTRTGIYTRKLLWTPFLSAFLGVLGLSQALRATQRFGLDDLTGQVSTALWLASTVVMLPFSGILFSVLWPARIGVLTVRRLRLAIRLLSVTLPGSVIVGIAVLSVSIVVTVRWDSDDDLMLVVPNAPIIAIMTVPLVWTTWLALRKLANHVTNSPAA